MKARRLAVLALALVTVVTMGVGYAALNDALYVNGEGNLTKQAADDMFNAEVYYSAFSNAVNCTAELVQGTGDTADTPDTATVTINNTLAIVGDTATVTLTVKNDSDVPVTIVTNTSADSDHFRVTAEYANGNTIQPNSTLDIVVKIVLKQTVSADVTGETFGISFNAASAG